MSCWEPSRLVSLRGLLEKEPSLLLFGGKGGVGKTTCASAASALLSELGFKTLLISSDPAPSLSDLFGFRVGAEVVPVQGLRELHAVEIDRSTVVERWKRKFGEEVFRVASSAFPVDRGIIDYVAEAPGIDEEFLLDYILELVEEGRYDKIVWDTAPAGHTLRLLHFPEHFTKHLETAARMYYRIAASLASRRVKRAGTGKQGGAKSLVETLEGWKLLADRVIRMLRDDRTEFIIVTIPEAMGVRLSLKLYEDFENYGLHVRHMIVNNVIPEESARLCAFCAERREMQLKHVAELGEFFDSKLQMVQTPLLSQEIQGVEGIRDFARYLFPEVAIVSRT